MKGTAALRWQVHPIIEAVFLTRLDGSSTTNCVCTASASHCSETREKVVPDLQTLCTLRGVATGDMIFGHGPLAKCAQHRAALSRLPRWSQPAMSLQQRQGCKKREHTAGIRAAGGHASALRPRTAASRSPHCDSTSPHCGPPPSALRLPRAALRRSLDLPHCGSIHPECGSG